MKCLLIILTLIFSSVVWGQVSDLQSHKGFEAFKKNVYPVLRQQCVMCHDDGGKGPNHSSSDPWVSYQKVLSYVNFGNLKYSKFVTKGTNGHGNAYGGQVTITQDELITVLQKWWDEGENESFFEGKKILRAQTIPILSDDGSFKTLSWDLSEIDQSLQGVKFQIDIQRFMKAQDNHGGAYRLKNPRFIGGQGGVKINGIHVVMNGIWDMMANDYAAIQGVAGQDMVLSSAMQIVLERSGENKDQISFAFEKIVPLNDGQIKMFLAQDNAKGQSGLPRKINPVSQDASLKVFNEAIVGKAAEFVRIKPGHFEMGSLETEPNRSDNEILHKVKLTKSFEIQATPTTQLQWYLITGQTPSYFKDSAQCDGGSYPEGQEHLPPMCKHHPVEQVSWDDIQGFIKKLNELQNNYTYRLPTEAEWEYVARAGLPTEYPYGFGTDFDGRYAWFDGNSKDRTHAVALKEPIPSVSNPEDLIYDMYGNVWEWVQDWYGDYPRNSVTDPTGPLGGSGRVVRGGSWGNSAQFLRSAARFSYSPGNRYNDIGFRLVRTPK